MFDDCIYDGTGAVLCTYRGYPFQCSELETPDEWAQIQGLVASGDIEIAPYVAPAAPTSEAVAAFDAATVKVQRDALLAQSDWIVSRHRDQRDSGVPTSLTNDQYVGWLTYRQALRDITLQDGWPSNVSWPTSPALPADS